MLQKLMKNNVRRFFTKEIESLVDEYEKEKRPIPKEIVKRPVPFGYIGGLLSEEAGGVGRKWEKIIQLKKSWLLAILSG
jgi:alkylation response protein AidB-like acyl-CoA dehydrogenase